MSFDMYLMNWSDGVPGEISADDFHRCFDSCPEIKADEFGVYPTYGPAESCEVYGLGSPGGIQISRPCQDIRLWDSIYALLATGQCTLIWPDGRAALTATDFPIEQLDPDFYATYPELLKVDSGASIQSQL